MNKQSLQNFLAKEGSSQKILIGIIIFFVVIIGSLLAFMNPFGSSVSLSENTENTVPKEPVPLTVQEQRKILNELSPGTVLNENEKKEQAAVLDQLQATSPAKNTDTDILDSLNVASEAEAQVKLLENLRN